MGLAEAERQLSVDRPARIPRRLPHALGARGMLHAAATWRAMRSAQHERSLHQLALRAACKAPAAVGEVCVDTARHQPGARRLNQ